MNELSKKAVLGHRKYVVSEEAVPRFQRSALGDEDRKERRKGSIINDVIVLEVLREFLETRR